MTNQLWKIWCRLLFNFWFENAWIRGNSKATSLNENRKRTQSELFVSTLKTWFSRATRYDSDKRKTWLKKYYWDRIENIWVSLWKFLPPDGRCFVPKLCLVIPLFWSKFDFFYSNPLPSNQIQNLQQLQNSRQQQPSGKSSEHACPFFVFVSASIEDFTTRLWRLIPSLWTIFTQSKWYQSKVEIAPVQTVES